MGRFIQNERIFRRRPLSQFLYSNQDPVNIIDPSGLQDTWLERLVNKATAIIGEPLYAINHVIVGLTVAGANLVRDKNNQILLEGVNFESNSARSTQAAILRGESPWGWGGAVDTQEGQFLWNVDTLFTVSAYQRDKAASDAFINGEIDHDQLRQRLFDVAEDLTLNAFLAKFGQRLNPSIQRALKEPTCKVIPKTTENAPELPPGWTYDWNLLWSTARGARKAVGPVWFDPQGGQWRWQYETEYHNPHWDYNPWEWYGDEWQNIPNWENQPPHKPNAPRKQQ